MTIVADCLSQTTLGTPQTHRNLTLFPLLNSAANAAPNYRLLDDALETGCARVTEVSESGSVPELRFLNDCPEPVLIVDGEELIGTKQNRIVNLSILAPAGKPIIIPVSCVEAGRWRQESAKFSSAKRAHFASGRARKSSDVSLSLRMEGSRRSNQSEVWDDIAAMSRRMKAPSQTSAAAALYEAHRANLDDYLSEVWDDIAAMSRRMKAPSQTSAAAALYEAHRANLDDYLNAFSPVEHQTGALFAINGKVLGLDLFDSSATMSKLLSKLIQSYAMDAIDQQQAKNSQSASRETASNFLRRAANAQIQQFPAVGEGDDLRLEGNTLSGGALGAYGRLIHLCAFQKPQANGRQESVCREFARASSRRGRFHSG